MALHIFKTRILVIIGSLVALFMLISKSSVQEVAHSVNVPELDIDLSHIKHDSMEMLKEITVHEEPIVDLPCTITNKKTNQFYDLTPLSSIDGNVQAWNSKGFDYGRNFSLGICSSPLKNIGALTSLDFVDVSNKSEVGGYYTNSEGHKVSIGQYNSELKLRGGNLVLEYSNGDICGSGLPKSTLLTFKCDREMQSKARVSYLGNMFNCSYIFEVRTIHACATAHNEDENAVWGLFIGILFVFALVSACAGTLYKIIKRHYERAVKK